ncbi:hypothetical protein LLH00_11230 [bacterium]|nr:hypothetical protein [bacterium]
MNEEMIGFLAVLLVFTMPAFIVWVVVSRRHSERIELIKQGINPDSNTLKISLPGDKALGWGLVFLAVGLAGVVSIFLHYGDEDLFFAAIASTAIGVALLIYYRLTAAQRVRAREIQERLLESGNFGAYSKLTVDNGDNEPK